LEQNDPSIIFPSVYSIFNGGTAGLRIKKSTRKWNLWISLLQMSNLRFRLVHRSSFPFCHHIVDKLSQSVDLMDSDCTEARIWEHVTREKLHQWVNGNENTYAFNPLTSTVYLLCSYILMG